jgi:hypothetical protein
MIVDTLSDWLVWIIDLIMLYFWIIICIWVVLSSYILIVRLKSDVID